MKKEINQVSQGKIAKLAGVSTSAVSLALQNRPGVGEPMRQKILRIAKELGYAPNASLSSAMAEVRKTVSKDLLPIAWLNTSWQKDSWQVYSFHTPYMEGARERALELGYSIQDIWVHEPGLTMKRLAEILYQRGIEGVVVTHPARHFRLRWDHLACVALGASLLAPRLHRVMADLNFNLQLALKSLKRLGYRRIGICMTREVDSASHHTIRATARDLYFSSLKADRIPPLFHVPMTYYQVIEKEGGEERSMQGEMIKWLKRYKPEVIVGFHGNMKAWVEAAGYRVPRDIGIVHLAVDDDVLDWAGIHSRRRETGATVIEWLVSMMRNHQYGVPKTPLTVLVRGVWQMGKTLKTKNDLLSDKIL